MTKFRPCIDLDEGAVKQIVEETLDSASAQLRTNFVSDRPSEWFAEKYRADELDGGHVIKLGPGNDEAAKSALAADRPPEWEEYRFEADIIPAAVPERFQVQVSFGDRVSNRQRGGVPKKIVDKIAELRMIYADFWQPMAWKKVVIEQIWNREKKSWGFEMKWKYWGVVP